MATEEARGSASVFLAIGVPSRIARSIWCGIRDSVPDGLKLVSPDRYHVTLVHYGRVSNGTLDALGAAVTAIASKHRPLTLELAGSGQFKQGAVLWIGVRGETRRLGELRNELFLATMGFGESSRRFVDVGVPAFRPHVTVAEQQPPHDRDQSYSVHGLAKLVAGDPFVADHLTLFESRCERYRAMTDLPLADTSHPVGSAVPPATKRHW